MANVDAPFGLRPIRYHSGAPYNGAVNKYFVASGTASLFIGDPVIKNGSSNTTAFRGYAPGTLPDITKATAGTTNRITGVIVGFEPAQGFDTPVYGATGAARVALVADDPALVFEIQDDGGSLAATSVGLNGNLIFTHSGSTVTGRSGVELDSTSDVPAATQADQLVIVRLSNKPSNELAANAVWEVRINQHTEADNVAGVA